MYLYGHIYKSEYQDLTFTDIPSFTNSFIISFFGYDKNIVIDDNEKIIFDNDIEIQCIFDNIIIRNYKEYPILLSITNNKITSVNNFIVNNNDNISSYSKPGLFEYGNTWFIYINAATKKDDDEIIPCEVSFYLPTVNTIDYTTLQQQIYTYPKIYDYISNKEYLLPSRYFKNYTDKYIIITSFCYILEDINLEYDSSIVVFQDGIQTNKLEQGIHRVDFYLDPNTEITFDENILFLPEDSFTVYPKAVNISTSTLNTLYRLMLPSVYDFVKVIINGIETPSLRIGNYIYFTSKVLLTKDTDLEIENERPSVILDSKILRQCSVIQDITYTLDDKYISIIGKTIKLDGDTNNKIINYDINTNEINIMLDLHNYYKIPSVGEYFTINAQYLDLIKLDNTIFTITEVDSSDISKVIIKGVRHE